MAHVITAVFAIGLIIIGAVTLTNSALSSAGDIALSFPEMVGREGEKARTKLELITADSSSTSTNIDISVRNAGQTALAEFSRWELLIQYYESSNNVDLKVLRLTHTTSTQPASGQWTKRGIYMDAATQEAEVYEPNVFNPGEEMVLRLNVSPAIPENTDNLVTVATANGVTLSAPFSR